MAATPRVICVGTGNTAELVVQSGFLLNLVDQEICSYDIQGCFKFGVQHFQINCAIFSGLTIVHVLQ